MGGFADSEIPLLLSFLYLFSEAETDLHRSTFWFEALGLASSAIRSEDSVRRGV